MLLLLKYLCIKDWRQVTLAVEELVADSIRSCSWNSSPPHLQDTITTMGDRAKRVIEKSRLMGHSKSQTTVITMVTTKTLTFLEYPTPRCCSQARHSQQKLLLLKLYTLLRGKIMFYTETSWIMLTMSPADLLSNAVFPSANLITQSLLY